ncbi:unnamed protein product [Hermetia illucens]|uniref:Uncharacterized protein n=1 Tax=Hermetia illucens TaxID=343691 RepID=A0A7R8UTC5_HERIL|nr:unnamed protein product [Hermetia illucens]
MTALVLRGLFAERINKANFPRREQELCMTVGAAKGVIAVPGKADTLLGSTLNLHLIILEHRNRNSVKKTLQKSAEDMNDKIVGDESVEKDASPVDNFGEGGTREGILITKGFLSDNFSSKLGDSIL